MANFAMAQDTLYEKLYADPLEVVWFRQLRCMQNAVFSAESCILSTEYAVFVLK